MRWLHSSTMKIFTWGSRAREIGHASVAAVAGPPSPVKPWVLFAASPAMVLIVPELSTIRTTLLRLSGMKKLPAESAATAVGQPMPAAVAGPPSPVEEREPLPATVLMIPAVTLRIRRLPRSAMYRLPLGSKATASGRESFALVARHPSPSVSTASGHDAPPPAIVLMRPAGVTFRTTLLLSSAMYRLPALSTAMPKGLFRLVFTALVAPAS